MIAIENKLPTSWSTCPIEDIAYKRPLIKPSDLYEVEFPYIDTSAVDNTKQVIREVEFRPIAKAPSRARKLVKNGDIIFSTVRVYLKNIALAKVEHDGFVCSTAFAVITPRLPELGNYMFHFVNWQKSIQELSEFQVGNSPPSMSEKDLFGYKIPLPPLEEQERIVDKIDELFSSIEAGERAIVQARAGVARYRKAILKAAVTGELTADWRIENPSKESAKDLLVRILTARFETWEKSELAKLDAKSKARPETEKQWEKFRGKYKVPVNSIEHFENTMPTNWVKASFSTLSNEQLIGLVRRSGLQYTDKNKTPYVKMNNITDEGNFDEKGLVYIDCSEEEKIRFKLKEGDLLFNTRNSSELVGKSCILNNDSQGYVYNNNIMRVRFSSYVSSKFVWIYLNSPNGKRALEKVKRSTTNVAAIYANGLNTISVATPPIAEQVEIVNRVDQALSRADAVTATLDAQSRAAKALKQAVLKTAFEGKLVPQNPKDEPASELLKRIKAAS